MLSPSPNVTRSLMRKSSQRSKRPALGYQPRSFQNIFFRKFTEMNLMVLTLMVKTAMIAMGRVDSLDVVTVGIVEFIGVERINLLRRTNYVENSEI